MWDKRVVTVFGLAVVLMVSCLSHAVIVTGQRNFDGQMVDTAFTQSSWTEQVTLTDGVSGESATIDITMSDTSGVNWWPVGGVATVGGDGWIDPPDAPIIFNVALVSTTAGVTSVGFHISSMGILPLGSSTITWTSNATPGPVVNVVAADNDYLMDGATDFHNLTTNYVGSFTTSSLIQLSGAGSNVTGTGLHFAVDLGIPEPASLGLLAAGGLLALSRRRKA
jgi:hypothetical protein